MNPLLRTLLLALTLPLAAPASAHTYTLVVATFNGEFLVRQRVHVKFGLPFRTGSLSAEARAVWDAPGFRDARFAEATGAVAAVLADLDAEVLALTEVGDEDDVA